MRVGRLPAQGWRSFMIWFRTPEPDHRSSARIAKSPIERGAELTGDRCIVAEQALVLQVVPHGGWHV
jgi:hypothetical protein